MLCIGFLRAFSSSVFLRVSISSSGGAWSMSICGLPGIVLAVNIKVGHLFLSRRDVRLYIALLDILYCASIFERRTC